LSVEENETKMKDAIIRYTPLRFVMADDIFSHLLPIMFSEVYIKVITPWVCGDCRW